MCEIELVPNECSDFRFANWATWRRTSICVICDHQALKCAKFQFPTGIHWPICSSECRIVMPSLREYWIMISLLILTAMSLVRITRMKSARGFHSPSWPIAFQHSFSHLPVSTKWPFGRWASTRTTKPNSKTTQNRGRLSFRSFCKRNTISNKSMLSDGACGRTNFNLIRTKIQSQTKSLPKSQNIAFWPTLTFDQSIFSCD